MSNSIYDSLTLRAPVIVQKLFSTEKYDGTVHCKKYRYINRGNKHFGKKNNVFISFIDHNAYNKLLLKGSPIICTINNSTMNCYIITIIRDNSNNIVQLEVAEDDDEKIITPFPLIYKIKFDQVESMLIISDAYKITTL